MMQRETPVQDGALRVAVHRPEGNAVSTSPEDRDPAMATAAVRPKLTTSVRAAAM